MNIRSKKIVRTVAFGFTAACLLAGSAIAGGDSNPNSSYRGEAKSAVDLVGSLRANGERADRSEHQRLVSETLDANSHAAGGMARISLDGVDSSRVLSRAGVHGRVVVEPINNGAGLCVVSTPAGAITGRTSCWHEFPQSGILATWEYGEETSVSGIAADDVTSVSVLLSSGERVNVPVGSGLFAWSSGDTTTSIVEIATIRDDVSHVTPVGDPR